MRELDSDYESSDDSDDGRRSPVSKKARRYSSDRDTSEQSDDQHSRDGSDVDVPKPTSVQQRILAIAGQKYDDFMKELENVHKKKDRTNSESDSRQTGSQDDNDRSDSGSDSDDDSSHHSKSPNPKLDDERNDVRENRAPQEDYDTQAQRRENPALIPNQVPAPPMPPPILKLPTRPPPPMGKYLKNIVKF